MKDAWVSISHMDINVVLFLFKTHHKFLWWEWDTYEIERNVPYVKDPIYDGDYNTNRQLGVIEKMLEQEVNEFIYSHKNGKA